MLLLILLAANLSSKLKKPRLGAFLFSRQTTYAIIYYMLKVAINGFGRIGRNVFKLLFNNPNVQIVAINDLTDAKTLAHLLKYDSSYGIYDKTVTFDAENIIVDNIKIPVLAEKIPANLPWQKFNVDIVIESTGLFTKPELARNHLEAGAKKVVISAPAKGEGAKTIVLGVNDDILETSDEIISCASCTTNCIAPVMKVLEETFGVEKAMMTTIHSYTNSQRILDAPAKDLREARTAAENIIPTSTGASKATALTIPSLTGKFTGLSIRVPTPVVSLADITAILKNNVSKAMLQKVFTKAADEPRFKNILAVSNDELVSKDFLGNYHSCIVDLPLIDVVEGNMVKIIAWYDNEWGYSNRLAELTLKLGETML